MVWQYAFDVSSTVSSGLFTMKGSSCLLIGAGLVAGSSPTGLMQHASISSIQCHFLAAGLSLIIILFQTVPATRQPALRELLFLLPLFSWYFRPGNNGLSLDGLVCVRQDPYRDFAKRQLYERVASLEGPSRRIPAGPLKG